MASTRPATLPDGSAWPSVAAIVLDHRNGLDVALTRASLVEQDYPELETVLADDSAAGRAQIVAALATRYLIWLQAGDRLAPGALTALVLAAWLEQADIVVGLRLLVGSDGIAGVDIVAAKPGILSEHDAFAMARREPGMPAWHGGDILVSRAAIERCGGLSPIAPDQCAELWPRLARSGVSLARIGRPVLLQRDSSAEPLVAATSLQIAALNDTRFEGGAGIAHRRLIEALRLAGHDVSVHALTDESPKEAAEWTDAFPRIEAAIAAEAPDLVLVGNIHGATRSTAVLERLAARHRVAVVLHDFFPLTGRCAQMAGCERILDGCDAACPTPTFYPALAPSRIASSFRDKRRFLSMDPPPLLLANSRWTDAQARRIAPIDTPIARIDLAFPSRVFRPQDKAVLRRRLGLPQNDVLILFAAVILDQAAKGAADLKAALAEVARPGVGFVALGRIDNPAALALPGLIAPGPIGGEAELADWYGACDLHVSASRQETLGQTLVEAGLCGTPTIAYRAAGLTTAVIDGVSGQLVDPRPGTLASAIADLVDDPERRQRLSALGRIALEGRNSYAASYLSLHDALAGIGLLQTAAEIGRIRLAPSMADAFSETRPEGAIPSTTVAPAPPTAVRIARRLKHRIWGRAQPLWMRRALFETGRLRRLLGGA